MLVDLHSNNSMVVVLDETDRVVYRKRLPNNLDGIISALRSCAGQIQAVAVESTLNWYWLVDGLQEAGYGVHLVNTAAVKQYDGLKYSGDAADARHLAHLLRLGILPEQALAVQANLAVMHCIDEQIEALEHAILERATLREAYRALQTVSGIGKVLALTIALETGDIGRFASPGNLPHTPARSAAGASRMARKKDKATPGAASGTWPGPSSKRRTSRCATTKYQALLPEEERPHAAGGGHQGGGPQACARELPPHEER